MYEINLQGDIGEEDPINIPLIQSELDIAKGQELQIKINTDGGCVDTAFGIFELLENYKRENKTVITTITEKRCASSGIILLLAGNRRIVNNNTNPFIHEAHFHIVDAIAQANDLINAGFELEDTNFKIATLYAQKTSLDYDLARDLMRIETSLTPEECYNIGLSTELSKIYNKINQTPRLIIHNKKNNIKKSNMSKNTQDFFEVMRNFFSKAKNKIIVTVSGDELDFPDLSPDDVPKVGDEAFIDGKPAELEYRDQDGRKYVFSDGKLEKIFEPGEDDPDMDTENKLNEANATIDTLKAEIETLKADNKKYKASHDKFSELESEFLKMEKKNSIKSNEENNDDDDDLDLSDVNKILNKIK